ncbi:MAG: hypothetical protein WCP21_12730 [Armatimonadota bacterium]
MEHSTVSPAPTETPAPWQPLRDRAVWGILIVYLGLAITYNYSMALGFAPDEQSRHYPYVKFLANHWRLPVGDPVAEGGYLDIHPPLYYALLAPVYLAARGFGDLTALRALRLTSPPLIFLALLLWLPVLQRACGGKRGPTLFAFALTAWWPHLFVPAGALNNDVGLLVMSALLLYLVTVRHWASRDYRSVALWGVVAGLGTLMKTSALPPGLLLMGVALAWQHGRRCYADPRFWGRLGTGVGVALLVCGSWLGRNYLLYGQLSYFPGMSPIPEGVGKLEALFTGMVVPLVLRALNGLWASVWAQMGWFPPVTEPFVYGGLRLVTLLAVAGWVGIAARCRKSKEECEEYLRPAFALPALGFGLLLAMAIYISTFIHMGVYQGGRYLLPYLPGFTGFLTLGLRSIIPPRARLPLAVLFLLLFLALSPLAWFRLLTYWNPLVLSGKPA